MLSASENQTPEQILPTGTRGSAEALPASAKIKKRTSRTVPTIKGEEWKYTGNLLLSWVRLRDCRGKMYCRSFAFSRKEIPDYFQSVPPNLSYKTKEIDRNTYRSCSIPDTDSRDPAVQPLVSNSRQPIMKCCNLLVNATHVVMLGSMTGQCSNFAAFLQAQLYVRTVQPAVMVSPMPTHATRE